MNIIGVAVILGLIVWMWFQITSRRTIWDEMVQQRPSLQRIRDAMPGEYEDFHWSLVSAVELQSKLIKSPLYHSSYPYQSVRDAWQDVVRKWESMAVSPGASFLQADIAAGARMLASQASRHLQELRAFDTSPYRTTWFGTGQPKDPYDSLTVTLV